MLAARRPGSRARLVPPRRLLDGRPDRARIRPRPSGEPALARPGQHVRHGRPVHPRHPRGLGGDPGRRRDAAVMRQMAPWIFSPSSMRSQPGILAGFIDEMVRDAPVGRILRRAAGHPARPRLLGSTRRVPCRSCLVLVAESDIFIRPALSRRLLERLPAGRWAVGCRRPCGDVGEPGGLERAIVEFIRANAGARP